jgi:hypothetical protein
MLHCGRPSRIETPDAKWLMVSTYFTHHINIFSGSISSLSSVSLFKATGRGRVSRIEHARRMAFAPFIPPLVALGFV